MTIQGSRPLIAEVQCLVGDLKPSGGTTGKPMSSVRRAAEGFPLQRLLLICAVIEKRLKLSLYNRDIYVNVVGGLKLYDTASDLAVAVALVSSLLEVKVKPGLLVIGEIGLNGEIRTNNRKMDVKINQAVQLGFTTILTAGSRKIYSDNKDTNGSDENNKKKSVQNKKSVINGNEVIECNTLLEALNYALDLKSLGLQGQGQSLGQGQVSLEDIIKQRKSKYKANSQRDKQQMYASSNNKGVKKLYSPSEEAWMTDDSELLMPRYDDGDDDDVDNNNE